MIQENKLKIDITNMPLRQILLEIKSRGYTDCYIESNPNRTALVVGEIRYEI